MKGGWLRWLIIIVMGLLIFSSVFLTLFNLDWYYSWPMVAVLEMPFVLLLFLSNVKFRDTKPNALVALLSRLRLNRK
jgi:hypothetical protein